MHRAASSAFPQRYLDNPVKGKEKEREKMREGMGKQRKEKERQKTGSTFLPASSSKMKRRMGKEHASSSAPDDAITGAVIWNISARSAKATTRGGRAESSSD